MKTTVCRSSAKFLNSQSALPPVVSVHVRTISKFVTALFLLVLTKDGKKKKGMEFGYAVLLYMIRFSNEIDAENLLKTSFSSGISTQ